MWANNGVTPLERPKQWAGKNRLTDAELEQLKRDISKVYDDGGDAIFQNVVEAVLEKRKLALYDPTTGNYYSLPGILGGARVKEKDPAQKSNPSST